VAQSDLEVAIIGSGFAGLGMGIALRQRGETRFAIFEQAKGLGGTWRDNHYPGAGCDVPSPLYSFSFEPNPDWTRLYSGQAEILAYLEHCARKYELAPHLRFGQGLAHAAFDETRGHWVLELTTGQTVTARVLVSGMGGLSRPAIPALPGLERFEGVTFHSAQWRHDVPLEGKTVAVVGTGASAIQFVPRLQPLVKKLVLFQRTPPWILPKADRAHGPLERALYRRVPAAQAALRRKIFWQHELRYFALQNERLSALGARLARAHLRRQVKDPALRARLTPDYRLGCKRVLLSNDYFPAVASPNVELVTQGIDSVTGTGVRTRDGQEHAVDAIVLGTGFRATDLFTPLTLRGLGGVDLNDAWRGGLEAYRGTTVAGFPNLFFLVGPNTGLGHNSMILMIEAQIRYVLGALDALREGQLAWLDVKPAAQATYNAQLQARLGGSVWASGCSSWYHDAQGRNTTLWPGTTLEFSRLLARFDVEAYARQPRPLELVPAPLRQAAGGAR